MILFKNDWRKYPTAIVDIKTKNTSFIRMAALLKSMGVQNNVFFLALINPDLQGVDPFDPNLTLDQQGAIGLECKINPWYYFREVAKAPSKTGNDLVPFEANRGNIALYFCFFNHVIIFLIQIRQTGKSFSVDTLMTLLLNILCTNTQINLLTKDDTLRTDNITRIKDIDLELPHYLRQRGKADSNNQEGITVRSLNNTLKAHVPQKSPKAALNLGRGLTSPIFVIDEGPFQSNITISMPAALAAGTAARDMARKNGEPYGTILTTTAGKRDDPDGKFIFNLLEDSATWDDKFLDAEDEAALAKLIMGCAKSGELRVNCTLDHRQLGKTDEWLNRAIKDTMNPNVDAINRDFFNVWTAGTQSNPLPVAVLEKIRKSQELHKCVIIDPVYGYVTKWYVEENQIVARMKKGHYVLSLDTSDASGGDAISLLLVELSTGETIASGNYNETNLISFAQWLCTWFTTYDNFTAVIERRSSGVTIIDYLLLMLPSMGIDPFKRLFNLAVNNHLEDPTRWRDVNVPLGRRQQQTYVMYKKTFGFATSGSGLTSRTELYSTTLQLAAKKAGHKVKDVMTINQIAGLTTNNGRIDHAPGEHDDMVIAWLLCFWFITTARNLAFYGINSNTILSEVEKIENLTAAQVYSLNEQRQVRKDIEDLYEVMSNERDEFVLYRLENKLRNLNRKLVLEEGEIFSVDDLINSIRNKKKNNHYNR